jgi:hypothetical protein
VTAFWWIIAAVGMLAAGRIVVPRVIVPAWRAGRLSDERAAVLVSLSRGLTIGVIVLAGVNIVGLQLLPGLLTAVAIGLVYSVAGWRAIRHMFRQSR